MAIVIDASVVLALLLQEEEAGRAEEIVKAGGLSAPILLNLEVTNGIISGIRRKRMTKADGRALVEAFAQLPIAFDGQIVVPTDVFQLALSSKLTSYDASYLMLAQRLRAPLATFDVRLATAAKALSIPVLG